MVSKKCSNLECLKVKPIEEFFKASKAPDGYATQCKVCVTRKREAKSRTVKGVISQMYSSQKARSALRSHPVPTYTKEWLEDWLMGQELFHSLFKLWVDSGWERSEIPSVDRKDDYIGYTESNIQLMTCQENKDKSHRDAVNGTTTKVSKEVSQYTLDGILVCSYFSSKEVERQTGIPYKSIGQCCRGETKTSHGFIWKYTA